MDAGSESLTGVARWAVRLRALAGLALDGTAIVAPDADPATRARVMASFSDDRGQRRRLDGFVLASVLDVPAPDIEPGVGPDERIWAWRHSLESAASEAPSGLLEDGPGPVTRERTDLGVEIWTETELAALHAVSSIAEPGSALAARVDEAVRWHVESLQPDNATNHPWAVHAFAEYGERTGDAGALMHAEGLVHACLVGRGKPDRYSAVILLDSARAIERA